MSTTITMTMVANAATALVIGGLLSNTFHSPYQLTKGIQIGAAVAASRVITIPRGSSSYLDKVLMGGLIPVFIAFQTFVVQKSGDSFQIPTLAIFGGVFKQIAQITSQESFPGVANPFFVGAMGYATRESFYQLFKWTPDLQKLFITLGVGAISHFALGKALALYPADQSSLLSLGSIVSLMLIYVVESFATDNGRGAVNGFGSSNQQNADDQLNSMSTNPEEVEGLNVPPVHDEL